MLIDTAGAEFAESCPLSLPLPPHDAAEFVAEPLVEFLERAFNVGPLEGRRPTPDNGAKFPHDGQEIAPPSATSQDVAQMPLSRFIDVGAIRNFVS
jgi:hypothetical protein